MNVRNKLPIYEANEVSRKEYMTLAERKLRSCIQALLRDDGKGHHHAKYAELLGHYQIHIIPLKADPSMTAAIYSNKPVIDISEGFLVGLDKEKLLNPKPPYPDLFLQLNVLLRHELAHNLLKHQIRMMADFNKKFSVEKAKHLSSSNSIHELMNIIEDDEISNTRYNEFDKTIVRNMTLNGRLIGGLVTEDHRPTWANMSVEDMFDQLQLEIEGTIQKINKLMPWQTIDSVLMDRPTGKLDIIKGQIFKIANSYKNIKRPSLFGDDIKGYILDNKPIIMLNPATGRAEEIFPRYSELSNPDLPIANNFKAIIDAIVEEVLDNGLNYSEKDFDIWYDAITKSSPTQEVDLLSTYNGNIIITLYTPEEKSIAVEVLDSLLSEIKSYDEIAKKVSDMVDAANLTRQELNDMVARL